MYPQARSLISALQKNLKVSGWTISGVKRWSAAGLSQCHEPVPGSSHNPRLQIKEAGTTVASHQLEWSASAQNTRASLRPLAAAATASNVALSTPSDRQQFSTAPTSKKPSPNNRRSQDQASSISDWVAEWRRSDLARWLVARGEHRLVEGPLLLRDHPTYCRGLFTSRAVKEGEPLVQVSQGLIVYPQTLPEELRSALPEGLTKRGRMAVFLALERRRGGGSKWAPFVQALPPLEKMDSTIFWSEAELALLSGSNLAHVTRGLRREIAAEYDALRPVMESHPELFDLGPLSELEFQHGYALVCSRAWLVEANSYESLAMIPFLDFFNHDGGSTLKLSRDEASGLICIEADRDYELGEQVFMSYGVQSNFTLALNFGFTLTENPHDEVAVWAPLPTDDPRRRRKLAVLQHAYEFDLQAGGTAAADPGVGVLFMLKLSEFGETGRAQELLRRMQVFEGIINMTSTELDMIAIKWRGNRLPALASRDLPRLRGIDALLKVLFQLNGMYETCREQEARLAELLRGGKTSGDVGLKANGSKAESLGSKKEVVAGSLSGIDGQLKTESGPALVKLTESLEHVSLDDSIEFGGVKVSRRRVRMAYDVLRGEARVLKAAVNFLETRLASGDVDYLIKVKRGLAAMVV